MTDMNPYDSASFSRPDECRVTSLHLNLDVDFVSRTLCGFVDLAVKRMKDGVHNLILDAQMITVQKILDVDYGQELKFTLGENSAIFGSKLEVQLPVSASKWLCNEFLRRGLKFYFTESLNLFISLSIAILNL